MQSPQTALEQLINLKPYQDLTQNGISLLQNNVSIDKFKIGERLSRCDEINSHVFLILKGEVRFLVKSSSGKELITLCKKSNGEYIGWLGLLRGKACETVHASTEIEVLSIPSEIFVELCRSEEPFIEYFNTKHSEVEAWETLSEHLSTYAFSPKDKDLIIKNGVKNSSIITLHNCEKYQPKLEGRTAFMSSGRGRKNLGEEIKANDEVGLQEGFVFPARLVVTNSEWKNKYTQLNDNKEQVQEIKVNSPKKERLEVRAKDLVELGVIEHKELKDDDRFPIIKGSGLVKEGMAIIEMICLKLNLPPRKDLCRKYLEDQKKRGKNLSVENIGSMCENLGCQTQIGIVKSEHLNSVDYPAIYIENGSAEIIWEVVNGQAIISDPKKGLVRKNIEEFDQEEAIRLLLLKKSVNANSVKFGWSWFIPLVSKYKKALILVFAATLLAQLMSLAIPLLLQQIIDKVLSQGNVSTLNVLGSTMIILALFSGLLTGLRQFIFVDTTDRMDLTLGSAVIDRLLSLPLRYFEKRPVGELSQRLGELNNIRGFLTGTALISVMNLFFALMYLVVMIIYSPLLTGVALSTFPVYLALVIIIAPIYKQMIRKKAVAAAKTQSHLIEILTGIQTVKAQNSQLTARWKWQDRYKEFVNQGFRAVTVGTISGQIGGFLTQLSSLMIIWVGMLEILKGNLTLGQLIAFRIIAGNVTGPLLQLSKLYQGFQGVQLSMERLGDILNQTAEQTQEESIQVSLPAIEGHIRYEEVRFRFGQTGPYQVDRVSLEIEPSSFVGIVGQSGSGKSTLMKLIPRLYRLNEGAIYIDNYDISKVELNTLRKQIGMVPQDSLLFEGTIAENIALNDPTADDQDVIKAATIACAHDFIMDLPQGYATAVAERGSNLSGGQRQRIAIARTILDNPKLLIMDEATSALDYETERIVCLNIQEWAQEKTVLFITHRLNTIKSADRIILMNKGTIAEQGTHDELIANKGRYSLLFNQQGLAEGL